MNELLIASVSAVWLGILTSISPCPLATNIAAISFICRQVGKSRYVFEAGLLYILGRMLAYLVMGMLLVGGLLSIPHISHFLQKYMNKILGPLLILTGMFLMGMLSLSFTGYGASDKTKDRAQSWGIWGAVLLGTIFALSFCPVSAAIFFGSLMPLAVKHGSRFLIPSLFGIGTGLPVIVFAVLVAIGAQSLGKVFDTITSIELWARRITGIIFIGIGIYYSLANILGII